MLQRSGACLQPLSALPTYILFVRPFSMGGLMPDTVTKVLSETTSGPLALENGISRSSSGGNRRYGGYRISHATHRSDDRRHSERLECLSKAHYMDVDRSLLENRGGPPHAAKDLRARQGPIRMRAEEAEQPELGRTQLDRLWRRVRCLKKDHLAGDIDEKWPQSFCGTRVLFGAIAVCKARNRRDELFWRHGLVQRRQRFVDPDRA
jgi:hypothetical protein